MLTPPHDLGQPLALLITRPPCPNGSAADGLTLNSDLVANVREATNAAMTLTDVSPNPANIHGHRTS